MIDLSKIESIFLYTGFTDMRLGVNSLSLKISEFGKEKELVNKLFIFCSKSKRNIKVVEWNCDGYWLYQKKLTEGKFLWPKEKNGALLIEKRQLLWLLDGLALEHKHAHKTE